jgi:hypothetical protein
MPADAKKSIFPSYRSMVKKYLRTRDFYDLPESVKLDICLYHDMHVMEREWMASKPARLIIYPKDVKVIYGKSWRTGRRILQDLREDKGLPKGAPVTIKDFCDHTGLDYQTIHDFIMES